MLHCRHSLNSSGKTCKNTTWTKDPEICNFLKSGSACEGLKVGQPDEFDVIVPIVVTEEINEFHYNFITDYDRGVPPGFAIC